jgi:hypothetical protein
MVKTEQELIRIAIGGIIYDKALEGMGIYPAKAIGGENPYDERSEYQNGWNAAIMEIHKTAVLFSEYIRSLSGDIGDAFVTLLLDDVIMMNDVDGEVKLWVLMNDIFFWACADGEDVELDNLPLLRDLYLEYGYDGLIAWVAKKRGIEPQEPVITDEYKKARESA